MYICQEDKNGIELGTADAKVLLAYNSEMKLDKLGSYDLVISNFKLETPGMLVNSPGEYELRGTLINTNAADVDSDIVHYAEIVIEGVTIFYCFPNFCFNDQSYSETEDVDILMVNSGVGSLDLQKLLNRFDPEVFIVSGDVDASTKILIDAGMNTQNVQKKLKFKPEEFGNEDFVLQTYILN